MTPGEIERVPWAILGPEMIRCWGWPGGRFDPEHLTVYGPTGSGKTRFVGHVLAARAAARQSHIVMIATKRADRTITAYGWPVISSWPPAWDQRQVIYWARAKGISAVHRVPQRDKVKAVLDALWTSKSNTIVYIDELSYVSDMLKLGPELETFYREGRSQGITMVASMQRPSRVTRLAHSEAGWTVAFRPKDADDRRRVAEVLGDRATYQQVLSSLDRDRYEFLLRHDRTGQAYISHL